MLIAKPISLRRASASSRVMVKKPATRAILAGSSQVLSKVSGLPHSASRASIGLMQYALILATSSSLSSPSRT